MEKIIFSEKIKELCQGLNISQTIVANIIGRTQKTVSGNFKDDSFSSKEIFMLMESLGCKIEININGYTITNNGQLYGYFDDLLFKNGISVKEASAIMGISAATYVRRKQEKNFKMNGLAEILMKMGCEVSLDIDISDVKNREELYEEYYKDPLSEEARLRKNERQREYSKRVGYNTQSKKKYRAEKTKTYSLNLVKNTDGDIIERLEKEENKSGFIKDLIRERIQKEKLEENKQS